MRVPQSGEIFVFLFKNRKHAMTTNEGIVDRALRVIVGLALIGVALGVFGADYTSVWGWIGGLPLVTACRLVPALCGAWHQDARNLTGPGGRIPGPTAV
jgi:hypothetical protein